MSALKFLEYLSNIWVREGHNFLVEEEAPVDNLWYLEEELVSWNMDLFGNLSMELGNSEEDFGIVELGLDKQDGVLGSSTVC